MKRKTIVELRRPFPLAHLTQFKQSPTPVLFRRQNQRQMPEVPIVLPHGYAQRRPRGHGNLLRRHTRLDRQLTIRHIVFRLQKTVMRPAGQNPRPVDPPLKRIQLPGRGRDRQNETSPNCQSPLLHS